MYGSKSEAKANGWHSRRNQTDDAQRAERRDHRSEKARKREEAISRADRRRNRTDEEQLQNLIDRGHGFCGEAMSLKAKVSEAK